MSSFCKVFTEFWNYSIEISQQLLQKTPHFHFTEGDYENNCSCFTTTGTMNLYRLPQSAPNTVFNGKHLYNLAGSPSVLLELPPQGDQGEWTGKQCMYAGTEYGKMFLVSVLLGLCYKSHQVTSGFQTHLRSCQRTFDAFPSHLIHTGDL